MMIKVEELNKNFGKFQALNNINLSVEKGEIYGFIGHNGAGKSTTINILTGLSKASSGKCIVNGHDLSGKTKPDDLNLGYLPEEPQFYPWLTGFETLNYLGNKKKKSIDNKWIYEILEKVGLEGAANRRVGGYSRGMKQRLGIGVALINDSELLILDEPSSALDPKGRSDVINLILELKKMGKTVFFSTHILSDVERVCDRVSILSNGKILVEKPLNIILKESVLPIYDIILGEKCNENIVNKLKNIEGVKKIEESDNLLSVWVRNEDKEEICRKLLLVLGSEKLDVQSFMIRAKKLEDIFLEEVK